MSGHLHCNKFSEGRRSWGAVVVRGWPLADHVHGGGWVVVVTGVEVEGAQRRLDLVDERKGKWEREF